MLEKILQEIAVKREEILRSNEQPNEVINWILDQIDDISEVIRSHMEDDGWIPVEKMLPNKPIPVWVTNKIGTHCCVSVDTYHNGKWQYYDDGRIIAWKWKDNYPAPYRPKEEN